MNKTIYYVVRKGAYTQVLRLISENLDDCKQRAKDLAREEVDDYHLWEVYKYENYGSMLDHHNPECLFSTSKGETD
jgi:hypothetical protein